MFLIRAKYQTGDLEEWSSVSLELTSLCSPRQTRHHLTTVANSSSSSQLLIRRWQTGLYKRLNKADNLTWGGHSFSPVLSTLCRQCGIGDSV